MMELRSAAHAQGAVGRLDLVRLGALRARRKAERAPCRIEDYLTGTAVRVVDEAVETHRRVRPDIQVCLVAELQARYSGRVGTDVLIGVDAGADRECPGHTAMRCGSNASSSADLLLGGGGQAVQGQEGQTDD